MDPTQVDELKHMGQLKHGGRVKDQVMSESLYHFLSYKTCPRVRLICNIWLLVEWPLGDVIFLNFFSSFISIFATQGTPLVFFHIYLGSKKLSFITSNLLCDSCSLFFGNWVLEQVKGLMARPMYWFFLVSH